MIIEGPILVGIVAGTIAGTIVWLGQEFVKFVVYHCKRCIQTRKIRKTLNDLYGSLKPRESRDDHLYNTLFKLEGKLEGLVRYANSVDYDKKVDVYGVIKQIASILNFVWRDRNKEWGTEHDRSCLNIGSNELGLIKKEIESIGWLAKKERLK